MITKIRNTSLWAALMGFLFTASAYATTPTLDTSGIDLDWVLTEGMKLVGILVVVVCGIWALKKLKNLGGS